VAAPFGLLTLAMFGDSFIPDFRRGIFFYPAAHFVFKYSEWPGEAPFAVAAGVRESAATLREISRKTGRNLKAGRIPTF
jgi:hypothetical protein